MPVNKLFHPIDDIDKQVLGIKLAVLYYRSLWLSLHKNNFSRLSLVVGRHRSGKSMYAITEGLILDKTFWPEFKYRVVYDAKGFMRAINRVAAMKIHGATIVWDEAGVGMPSREWYDVSNKAVNYALQVIGYLNPNIIFVTQDASFLDSQAKKLLTQFIEMQRPNSKFSWAKIYNLFYDRRQGKIYYYYPRVRWLGRVYRLDKIRVPLPPDEVIKAYNKHSLAWKKKIMQAMERKAKELDKKLSMGEWNEQKVLEYVLANWRKFQTNRSRPDQPRLAAELIQYELKTSRKVAMATKYKVERMLMEKIQRGEKV